MLVQKCLGTKSQILFPWTSVRHYEFSKQLPAIHPSQLTLYLCSDPLKDVVGRWKEADHSVAVCQCTVVCLRRSFLWIHDCWSACSLLFTSGFPTLKTNCVCVTQTIACLSIAGAVACQRLCKVSKLGLRRATVLIGRCFWLKQVTEIPLVRCMRKRRFSFCRAHRCCIP